MSEETLLCAMALHRAFSLRCDEKERLLYAVEDVRTLERAGLDDLSLTLGRRMNFSAWEPRRAVVAARKDLRVAQSLGVRIVPVWSEDYPPLLRETYDPPFVLFVRGALPANSVPAVAVVGTRSPNNDGLRAARNISFEFARDGLPVISGLASGIDAAGHRGAVSASASPTFAVLGSGIDRIYPAANRTLAAAILRGAGGLISEYPPGFPVRRYHFPERNRIIAGLARWVLIVQAPERSGALITADYALDAGRELLVHTVGVTSEAACVGTRALADDGAPVVSRVADLLPEWRRSRDTVGRNAVDSGPHDLPEGRTPSEESGSVSRLRRDSSGHPSDISSLLARRLDRELDIFEPEPSYG